MSAFTAAANGSEISAQTLSFTVLYNVECIDEPLFMMLGRTAKKA